MVTLMVGEFFLVGRISKQLNVNEQTNLCFEPVFHLLTSPFPLKLSLRDSFAAVLFLRGTNARFISDTEALQSSVELSPLPFSALLTYSLVHNRYEAPQPSVAAHAV